MILCWQNVEITDPDEARAESGFVWIDLLGQYSLSCPG